MGGERSGWQVPKNGQRVTWEVCRRSVLKYNIRMLHYFGLWNLNGSRSYWVFVTFYLVSCTSSFITSVVGVCLSGGGIEAVAMGFVSLLPMIGGWVMVYLLFRHRAQFELLVMRLDQHVLQQRRFCDQDASLQSVLSEAHRKSITIMAVTLTYFFAILSYWWAVPLTAGEGSRLLPFNPLPWVESCSSSLYTFHFALQFYTVPYCTMVTFTFEFFFLTIMVNLSAQFRILGVRLRNLGQYVEKPEAALTGKSTCDAFEELCRCIESHQELLRYTAFLDDMMSPFAMLQFIIDTMTVCCVLYESTDGQQLSSSLKCAGWMPGLAMQLFIFCWGAHEVTEQGEAVSEAAYASPWIGASPRVRRALQVVMTRAQVPPVLTAGHLYPITRATFLTLLNAAYSYYALLVQMNGR